MRGDGGASPRGNAKHLEMSNPIPTPSDAPETCLLTVSMSAQTVTELTHSGYVLYGFKAVGSSDQAGLPLVWFATQAYSLTTTVSWRETHQAYTIRDSLSAFVPVRIRAVAAYAISVGQTLEVTEPNGIGVVVADGGLGVISIINQTASPLGCGLSQPQGDDAAPICAFPLHGHSVQVMAPMARLFLMFATAPLPPGTPIQRALGPGVLMDFEGANERSLRFDINQGWSWDGGPWAETVPSGSDIVPLLIVPPAAAER